MTVWGREKCLRRSRSRLACAIVVSALAFVVLLPMSACGKSDQFAAKNRGQGLVQGKVFSVSGVEVNGPYLESILGDRRDFTAARFSDCRIDSEALALVGRMKQLRSLCIIAGKIDEDGFVAFRRHPNIQEMDISCEDLPDGVLDDLSTCPQLNRIGIHQGLRSDELFRLSGLPPLELDLRATSSSMP